MDDDDFGRMKAEMRWQRRQRMQGRTMVSSIAYQCEMEKPSRVDQILIESYAMREMTEEEWNVTK